MVFGSRSSSGNNINGRFNNHYESVIIVQDELMEYGKSTLFLNNIGKDKVNSFKEAYYNILYDVRSSYNELLQLAQVEFIISPINRNSDYTRIEAIFYVEEEDNELTR